MEVEAVEVAVTALQQEEAQAGEGQAMDGVAGEHVTPPHPLDLYHPCPPWPRVPVHLRLLHLADPADGAVVQSQSASEIAPVRTPRPKSE